MSSSSSLGQSRPRPACRFVSVDDAFCRSAFPDQHRRASTSSDKASEAAPLALRRRFYETLLAPAFPLEEERDALDDWLECFAAQRRMRRARWRREKDEVGREENEGTEEREGLEGPAMDVILMVRDGREEEGAGEETWQNGGPSLLRSQSSGFGGLYAPAEEALNGDIIGSGSHHREPRRGSSFFGEIGASIPEEEKARSPRQRRTMVGDDGEEEKKDDKEGDTEKSEEEGDRSLEECTVVGGAAVEYYPRSRVGLLSYVVLHSDCRGRGLAKPLHDEALARLEALAHRYYPSQSAEPTLRAVFAETNTAAAGDVAPEMALRRHRALYNLGYRLVHFPYAQPPLSTANVDAAFDDIVLLVYFPYERWQLRDAGEDDLTAARFCRWYLEWRRREGRGEDDRDDRAVAMDADVPFGYVEEFYRSVFGDGGGRTPDYRAAEYYRLARWFARGRRGSSEGVAVSLCRPMPWEDCKEALRLEWKASDPEEVAGADV
ncbi:hypothetical protein ACHAXT_009005 [Thalassiosira profunda]